MKLEEKERNCTEKAQKFKIKNKKTLHQNVTHRMSPG